MDDIILPSRRQKGGVRTTLDVPAGAAAKIALALDDVVVVGSVGLRFQRGVYIILPLEIWTKTLRRSIDVEQQILDAVAAVAADQQN